ncbi:MAG: hypothetical protein AAGI28_06525 [Pseudomonadota bacterium]
MSIGQRSYGPIESVDIAKHVCGDHRTFEQSQRLNGFLLGCDGIERAAIGLAQPGNIALEELFCLSPVLSD